MAAQIGIVKALIGTATATAADGTIRNLQIGDQVFADELITTGAGGAIELEFADGSIMDLGRNSQAVLDDTVFNPEAATAVADTTDSEVDAIQAALLAGADPTQVGEATAAGAGVAGDGNEGHQPVVVDYLAPEAPVESGFDTTGIGVVFPEIQEELQAPQEPETVINVTLSREIDQESEGVYENETITYIATLSETSQGAITVTLSNGEVIVIAPGSLTGSATVPAQGDDPYLDGEVLSTNITSVAGGAGETLTFDSSPVQVEIFDTIDTTTVTLDDVNVAEDGTITYTASVDNAPQGAFSVTLNNGVVINFADGSLTGSSAPQAAQGDDVYVDGESYPISIASTSGGNYEALDTTDTATVTITDTIDTTTVTLTATDSTTISGVITYTATVDNAPQGSALILPIYDENDVYLGDITIAAGETQGTLDIVAPATPDASYDAYIGNSASGGNYEDLDITDTASTIVNDIPPSSALLITNSNVVDQEVRVTIASDSGSNTTGVVEPTEVQGQEGSALMFGDDVFFSAGETYTVTMEHVSGTPVILTDLSITDSYGNVLDLYEGNAKLETGDTGQNTNPDGYIFNVTIGPDFGTDPTDYTVSEPIGYEVLNQNLVLDTETNTSDFTLDFSQLSLNGGEDLFGDVESIDISGKGTGENNTITIEARDILDLGTGGDSTIEITGDTGDVVNLSDQDGAGAGQWTIESSDASTTTYLYSDGSDIARAIIDNSLTVNNLTE